MQQPLAHLYFLTIFDDLLHSEYNMSALINAAQSIGKVHMKTDVHFQCHYTVQQYCVYSNCSFSALYVLVHNIQYASIMSPSD